MILGFAQFTERSRKLKTNHQQNSLEKAMKKHEKSSKKGAKMEPKTMKSPSKKRCVFQGPPKNIFCGPGALSGRLQVAVLIFSGRFGRSPKSFQNQPSDAKSHEKSKPRASKNATQNQLVFRTSFLMISHTFWEPLGLNFHVFS